MFDYQFSHTYKTRELTDAEIYQIQVEREELEAAKKAVVNFYRDENTGEILTVCKQCVDSGEMNISDLTYIDKAGDWDTCGCCEAQNIPANYHGSILSHPNRQ